MTMTTGKSFIHLPSPIPIPILISNPHPFPYTFPLPCTQPSSWSISISLISHRPSAISLPSPSPETQIIIRHVGHMDAAPGARSNYADEADVSAPQHADHGGRAHSPVTPTLGSHFQYKFRIPISSCPSPSRRAHSPVISISIPMGHDS